jgi:SAM-dependent methyltransferase
MEAPLTEDAMTMCICAECRASLAPDSAGLLCTSCGATYEIVDGIPVVLPRHPDETRARYRANYDRIARDDLDSPIVAGRFELLHALLLEFIGDVTGKRILDIGSAYGSYLERLTGTTQRVAVDLALPYLAHIPASSGIIRICGDAEALPVALDQFDVIVVSDVFEHLLTPEALVTRMMQEVREDARVIVHIPWRESLKQYEDVDYEFTHLRSFDESMLRTMFWGFDIVRERSGLPRLDEAAVFRLKGKLPRRLYNAVLGVYFRTDLQQIEYRYRERWIAELPRRERWLLRLFEPQFKLFELRKRTRVPSPRLQQLFRTWLRPEAFEREPVRG